METIGVRFGRNVGTIDRITDMITDMINVGINISENCGRNCGRYLTRLKVRYIREISSK